MQATGIWRWDTFGRQITRKVMAMCGLFSRLLGAIGESRLFMSVEEKNFRQEVTGRKSLSPGEFAEAYYSSHPYPDVPARVSEVLCEQLGLVAVAPKDNIAASFPDIDFDEVIKEVAEELEIPFVKIKFNRFDGTVENMVNEMTRIWMTM